ncbi:MAG: hypothetical protein JXA90_17135 [Planctomycetes bacterium]|nr:hypothetical protein [Planctomycetota bacterium]
MYQGEYECTLDDKNRVVLPAGLRKGKPEARLSEGFTLAIGGKGQCLELHLMQDWKERIDDELSRYSPQNEAAQEYFRDIIPSAFEVFLDKNYRFVIPEARKKDAGIGKEVVFIGMWHRIEIWDKQRWEERRTSRAGKQTPPTPDYDRPPAAGN